MYLSAANSDYYAPAIFNLGRCYFYGIATTVDKQTAFEMFFKAANLDYPEANFMLGYMYSYGDGIAKDMVKAKEYLKKAANSGLKEASEELEKIYQKTKGDE